MSPLLAVSGVSFSVGTKALLRTVSLSVDAGEFVALVGPNGAGKSTLLRVLAGELPARTGSVHLKGRPLSSYTPRALARHRAVLSQNVHVTFAFTVEEVVRMGAGELRGPSVDRQVAAALTEVDLAAFGNRVITTLSGGEQQRAQLARILVQFACGAAHGPGVLLLDEPTASLDLRHQLSVLGAVRKRTDRGAGALAILHDLNLAAIFATRIVVLNSGSIDCDASPAESITNDMLRRVYGVDGAIGEAPQGAIPFVLPHRAWTI
jgi:iron complex transport system ATP-binding protein